MRRLTVAVLLVLTSAAACTSVGPDFVAPHEPLPDRYSASAGASGASGASGADVFWWSEFRDPELTRLEALANADNLDLQVAYVRLLESRIQIQAARAQGLPNLNADAKYTREQLGLAGIQKSQGGAAALANSPTANALIQSIEKPVNIWQLGFDASWELDLFGRVRRSVEAAKAQSAEAAESRNDLAVTLQAEVADTYFQLRAAQMQQTFARQSIVAQRDVVELTRSRKDHGLAGEPDLDAAVAQLASLESQLPPLDQSVATARHALAVLAGQPANAFDAELGGDGKLPDLPPPAAAGVPASLARRRPDIRAAEAALHAATAEIGVEVAALFPEISLSGNYGLRNTGTQHLFDWASRFYSVSPAISLPIFRGGALRANVRLSRAQAAEAEVSYRKVVLSALQEVEDGLTGLHDDDVRTAALDQVIASEQRALDVNLDAYRRGLTSYLSILSLQLQLVQAQQQRTQSLLAQGVDRVKLYKALGGGWDGSQDPVARAR